MSCSSKSKVFFGLLAIALFTIVTFVGLVFGLCACDPSNPVTITYVATDGGSIVGETTQRVGSGKTTSEVEAIPDEGYKFVKWSDGSTASKRTDEASEDATYTALFADSSMTDFSVTYTTADYTKCTWDKAYVGNSSVEGNITVTVTPSLGYRFVCWSDGQTSPTRSDDFRSDGETYEAQFAIDELELPVMIINTDDGGDIVSKEEYKSCKISVTNADKEYCFENTVADIRGRGNSSWAWDKKPYKLKFKDKIDLFGHGKAKKWTLIANYCDYSLSRNYIVYSLAAQFSELSKTTTDVQFVDVYLNGRYDGVYTVCEQVETGSNRVDIEDDLEKVPEPEKLGFLIELDRRPVEDMGNKYPFKRSFEFNGDHFITLDDQHTYFGGDGKEGEYPFGIKTPDYDDAAELGFEFTKYEDYIRNYMSDALKTLWNGNYAAVQEKFDVESWAEGYIIDELFKNVDVAYSSFYMFKDNSNGKLYRGPLWDYDISSDNCNYFDGVNDADKIYATRNPIYSKLLGYSGFRALVTDLIKRKQTAITETMDGCVEYVLARADAFNRNFERWQLLNNGHFGGNFCPVPDHLKNKATWKEEVQALRDWLGRSFNRMLSEYR